jgi:hypothetical protein
MTLRSTRLSARLGAILACAALVAGCAGASQADAPTSTDELQLAVRTDPQPLRSGQPGAFLLEVTNEADRELSMSFDTTQRGDVALETNGVEVYRWAARRVFAHDETQVTVGAGETVTFRLDELRLPVGPGDYEHVATLSGQPKLQVIREPLTVAGSSASSETSLTEQSVPSEAPTTSPTDAESTAGRSTTSEAP